MLKLVIYCIAMRNELIFVTRKKLYFSRTTSEGYPSYISPNIHLKSIHVSTYVYIWWEFIDRGQNSRLISGLKNIYSPILKDFIHLIIFNLKLFFARLYYILKYCIHDKYTLISLLWCHNIANAKNLSLKENSILKVVKL